MDGQDRRREPAARAGHLHLQLNEAQRATLNGLERFGWELKFIRRPLFQEPVPVVFDGERKAYAALRPDGTLDDRPAFDIRH
ncbi:MAG TPA: hypothetical protein VGD21_11225 [Lysobacter sp.]